MKQDFFTIDFQGTALVGDTIAAGIDTKWLCLHGAGQADRKRFFQLRRLLANKGIGSCSFDFVGHGETGGNLIGSSLESRVAQASAVIDSQEILQPLSIVASSMGGHVAIKLMERYEIENLVLLAPAVYGAKSYGVPFGPAFTEVIRGPFSWRETDVWKILENYKGNLLIFEAEKDQIIPHEVIKRIYDSAENAKSRKVEIIEDATHSLAKWLDEHPIHLENLIKKVCELK